MSDGMHLAQEQGERANQELHAELERTVYEALRCAYDAEGMDDQHFHTLLYVRVQVVRLHRKGIAMKWKDGGGGDFKQPPAGTHQGRAIGLVDLGTQRNEYQGQTNLRRQVLITWELPGELMESGKPYVISKFYTQSLNEKSRLYNDLVNWRGKEFSSEEPAGFDAKAILDKPCLLSVTMNDAGKARVTGLMAQPKHMQCPPRVNDLTYFSLEPGEFDRETFDRLGEGIQRIIRLSPEWAELQNPTTAGKRDANTDVDDDIPF